MLRRCLEGRGRPRCKFIVICEAAALFRVYSYQLLVGDDYRVSQLTGLVEVEDCSSDVKVWLRIEVYLVLFLSMCRVLM